MEEELIKARDKAEQSDRLKLFSGQYKSRNQNPYNGIIVFAHLLKKPNVCGENQQNLYTLSSLQQRMLNIINEVIDSQKLYRGCGYQHFESQC